VTIVLDVCHWRRTSWKYPQCKRTGSAMTGCLHKRAQASEETSGDGSVSQIIDTSFRYQYILSEEKFRWNFSLRLKSQRNLAKYLIWPHPLHRLRILSWPSKWLMTIDIFDISRYCFCGYWLAWLSCLLEPTCCVIVLPWSQVVSIWMPFMNVCIENRQ